MRLPAMPRSVNAAGGKIKVRVVKRLKQDGVDCWGTWDSGTRTIRILKGALPATRWKTLYHELAHATLDDSGIANLLSLEGQEALCDAFGTARFLEAFGDSSA